MLKKEQNDLPDARPGPARRWGELFRVWLPALLAEELPEPIARRCG
jgi:hypothetical protein